MSSEMLETRVDDIDQSYIVKLEKLQVTMSFFKIPTNIPINVDAHKEWCHLLKKAESVVKEDIERQHRAAHGMCLKPRSLPPETIGRAYAQYCDLVNKMYDSYMNSVHLQRAPYMKEIVSVFLKRLYELRQELELIIVNDYIYVDNALRQLHMTPFDIQIVVPYYLKVETRPDSIEQMLQEMWAEAYRRKHPAPKEPALFSEQDMFLSSLGQPSRSRMMKSLIDTRSVIMADKSAQVIRSEEYIIAVVIQKHERYRHWNMVQHNAMYNERKSYHTDKLEAISDDIKNRAADLMQRIFREYMKIKRLKCKHGLVDKLLGIIPNPFIKRMSFEEQNNRMYDKRRSDREKIHEAYMKELEKENTRLLIFRKEEIIDDITDEIYDWFKEWYYGYGFFPQYPHELEGGTILLLKGKYPTIDEKKEMDEALAKATKGKTKEQIKKDKAKAKADEEKAAIAAREVAKKEKVALLKARLNPRTDPGYTVHQSRVTGDIVDTLAKYRASWSLFDKEAEEEYDFIYGYLKSLLTEELMQEIHIDCRMYVDALRRLDLKLLNRAQKKMFKLEEKHWTKVKPRRKPKKPARVKPFVVDDALMATIPDVFDLDLVSKPTNRIKDIWGEMNYAAYDYSVLDPDVQFKTPGYGDIRRRLLLSCAFGTGIAPGAKRNKSILLLGPERNGKSFLADCVAGEINAVKIDISPEKFSAVSDTPAKLMNQVLTAARAFQPTVIFIKNVERVFAKKVPPESKYLRAKVMNPLLTKLLKSMNEKDKIIVIATCSFPHEANHGMMHLFHQNILVPITDYATLQFFFYNKLQAIRSMPRDYCVQPLAQLLLGYGFGLIFELFDQVMTPARIVDLCIHPLCPMEFLKPLLASGKEPTTQLEYMDYVHFSIEHSHLRQPRHEYNIINASRKVAYERIAKKKKDKKQAKTT